jgi:hypothetical protein
MAILLADPGRLARLLGFSREFQRKHYLVRDLLCFLGVKAGDLQISDRMICLKAICETPNTVFARNSLIFSHKTSNLLKCMRQKWEIRRSKLDIRHRVTSNQDF